MASFAQFRIFHLLLLVLLVAVGLWLATQAEMTTAKVEVLEVSGLSFIGPNGSQDNFGPWRKKIRFRFVDPKSLSDTVVNVFLNSTVVAQQQPEFGENKTVVVRFREEPVLWMRPEDPALKAVERLGFQADDVEEVIMAVYPPDFTPESTRPALGKN